MKTLTLLFVLAFIALGSACSTFNGSASSPKSTVNETSIPSSQPHPDLPKKYIQVLDELIANGCDISKFELSERAKALDMKVACK